MKEFPKTSKTDRIIKFDRNKLFKGHSGELFTCGKDELALVNSYYSGTVTNRYSVKDNTTETRIYITNIIPKWLSDKLKSITPLGNVLSFSYTNDIYNINIVTYDHIQLSAFYKDKGISFSNHFDNISELKKLKKHLSLFIKTIKNTKTSDIIDNMVPKDGPEVKELSYCLDCNFMEKYSRIS